MDQLVHVILIVGKVHIAPQSALDCRPDLGGLNQVCRHKRRTSSA